MRTVASLSIPALACMLLACSSQRPAPVSPATAQPTAPFDGSSGAALTSSAVRLIHQRAPDLELQVPAPLTIALRGGHGDRHDLRVSLDRMWATCQQQGGACERDVTAFVDTVVRIAETKAQPPQRAQIFPEIRPRSYFDQAGIAASKAILEPFVDDLVVFYVVDAPDSAQSLREEDAKAIGLSRADLGGVARENLARGVGPLTEVLHPLHAGEVQVIARGQFYESSRLLLSSEWAALAPSAGGSLVVAIPSNDVVIVAPGLDPAQTAKLRAVVHEGYQQADRPVSDKLYLWERGTWRVAP